MHPKDLPAEALKLWSKIPGRPDNWTHWSIDANQTRRSRAERFLDASTAGSAGLDH